jgi:hypothetical protein
MTGNALCFMNKLLSVNRQAYWLGKYSVNKKLLSPAFIMKSLS